MGKKMLFLFIFCSCLVSINSRVATQDISTGVGKWDGDLLGNHRVVLRVAEKADTVLAHIPWRRRDLEPEKKNLILIDAKTGRRVLNIRAIKVTREFGDIAFQPLTVPGEYYLYFMPANVEGRNYPKVTYKEPEQTGDVSWRQKPGFTRYGRAEVLEIQSVDEFSSFYPMEFIATAEETQKIIAAFPQASYLVFPEDRLHSIRMTNDLPVRWSKTGPQKVFQTEASRGEFCTFQLAIFACRETVDDISLRFGDLKTESGTTIPSSAFLCLNIGGISWNGQEFKKVCRVEKGKIHPLWCGVQVPLGTSPGKYVGEIIILPKGLKDTSVKLEITVKNDTLNDAGDGEPGRFSRLRWLNSKIALDDAIVPPFIPIEIEDNSVSCLGRILVIGNSGFPEQILSFFSPEVTQILSQERKMLSGPVKLAVEKTDGALLVWSDEGPSFTQRNPGTVAWEARSASGPLALTCQAQMEFDGFVEYKIRLSASKTVEVKDIRLEIPLNENVSRYMMGMGFRGGHRPSRFHWMWDPKNNQDALWVGDVNAGLQVSLRAENYSRPLNTNFYLSKPLNMPPSWHNNGNGGCSVREIGDGTVLIAAYSGKRKFKAGETLFFNFNLLLTPFKLIDPKAHFATRFFHAYKPLSEVAKTGANTINIHHATEINPYINYPFLRSKELGTYINEAHKRGYKVKIYYTIRELSNRAPELFALRSLGHEIFSPGPGGGYSWLQEHLGSDYIAAWHVPELKDSAIINSGMSRWHNYYLEGLDWLVKNVGIDGLYIDDVAFDRTTMKRARKILDRGREGALIDLHSANQYNVRDGFASSANLYLEHFPYLNRIWFGEYFDYGSSPDYWLVELSGIPFGLTGEMLQDGGNPWRGMVYGMTNRLPWSGQDPARIWKIWDDFGISESRMIGYWSPNCPVRTDHPDVLASAYVNKNKVLIALASWAKNPVNCSLKINWEAVGLDLKKAQIRAPAIADYQERALFKPADRILVQPGKGWLLILF